MDDYVGNALEDRSAALELAPALSARVAAHSELMKRRIFLGLAPIFVLILVMGAYAVLLFAKLGTRVDVILRENFRSVLAGQQMKEASERMDSGLFFSLVGEEERGRGLYTENLPVFQEGLRIEVGQHHAARRRQTRGRAAPFARCL